jgi:2'-phosphotransferase
MQWSRLKSLQVTFGDIHTACTTNAKQRFSLKPHPAYPTPDPDTPSHWLIRANQGHSIALSSAALLTPITLEVGNVPSTVVHGTYYALYPTIVASSGLSKMRRNHIHFSTGLPGGEEGTVSGMRADAELLIYVDIRKSLAEGVLWWLSDNGVVLTEGDKDGFLGTRYWSRVEGRTGEVGTLWKDGEWVADLPEGAKGKKVPVDKMLVGKRGVERSRGSRAHGRRGTGKEMKELDTLGEGEGLGMSVP